VTPKAGQPSATATVTATAGETSPAPAVAINATTRRKIEALYSSDNWIRRRRVLFHAIYWKMALVTIILMVTLVTAVYRPTVITELMTTTLTVVVPALLLSISAEVATYVFGGNQDDKNKRENLPSPAPGDVPPVVPPAE
jgi:hypothetical protein